MKLFFSGRRSHGVSGVLAALLVSACTAGPALAHTTSPSAVSVDTSACFSPVFSQPFLSSGDAGWYTLAPGETPDSFDGTGWTLTGGAQVSSAVSADGSATSVLDLPSGSQAVSPAMCVASDYPTARTVIRDVRGSQGVQVAVAYAGTHTADKPQTVGQVHGTQSGWTLSNAFNVHPGNLPGWQLVRFTLTPGGQSSEFQIYDFYVDPRMRY